MNCPRCKELEEELAKCKSFKEAYRGKSRMYNSELATWIRKHGELETTLVIANKRIDESKKAMERHCVSMCQMKPFSCPDCRIKAWLEEVE